MTDYSRGMNSVHHDNPDFYYPICGYTGKPTRKVLVEDDRSESGYGAFIRREDGQNMAYRFLSRREALRLRQEGDDAPQEQAPVRKRTRRRA